jgi:hypothetical protein
VYISNELCFIWGLVKYVFHSCDPDGCYSFIKVFMLLLGFLFRFCVSVNLNALFGKLRKTG